MTISNHNVTESCCCCVVRKAVHHFVMPINCPTFSRFEN